MSRQRSFTYMIEPSRRHRRNLDLSSLSTPKKLIESTIPEDKMKEDLEEELSKIKSFRLPSCKPMAQSFFRIRRRPILKTQFSNIEEVEEENDSEVFVFLRLVCLEDYSDFKFETRDVAFPINRVYCFGKSEENYLRFDSSSDSEPLSTIKRSHSDAASSSNKIGFDCNFISKEHAELWYDENQQILCTGFPLDGSTLCVDEVRVDSWNGEESLRRRNSCNVEETSGNKRIQIKSGDVVTLVTSEDDGSSSKGSISFRLYYRTGEESYRDTWSSIGAKSEAINAKMDRLLNLEKKETAEELEAADSSSSSSSPPYLLPFFQTLKNNLFFLILPSLVFLFVFVLFGETNRKLITF